MHRLFLSYSISHSDEPHVLALIRYAREQGVDLVLPQRAQVDGVNKRELLVDSIGQCTGFWGLVTKDGNGLPWMSYELGIAHAQNKPVVLFVEEGTQSLPHEWRSLQYFQFNRHEFEKVNSSFLSNLNRYFNIAPDDQPSSPASSGKVLLGAVAAGLLLYWLSKDE